MARPRKQTYTMEMYLKKIQSKKICNDADVQRNFVWKKEHINELIATVLTDDYIPPIILGEEEDSQLHIVDGGCRSAALMVFRYGNYKITSSIENSVIHYKKRVSGKEGNTVWEEAVFDIKNKTYEKLPEELKEKFDEYQIETVIHESCNSSKISKYIKRYNNHVSMNTDQKAFTYIDKFAGRIHKISDSRFFTDCTSYSESDKVKGAVERMIVESVMCMNHFDNWKTQAKTACKYLNENAAENEFEMLAEYVNRLENIITDDIKDIFNKKDSFIFLTLFDKFSKLGAEDKKFAEFLRKFKNAFREVKKNKNGLLFDEIDKDLGTKDRQVIAAKLEMLEGLMKEFLHMEGEEHGQITETEAFIAENLNMDVEMVKADMDFYNESLELLLENTVRIDSGLRHEQNRPSLLAMMAYSYKNDVDLDEWLTEYAERNNSYHPDQKKNFLHMKDDLKKFQKNKNRRIA